MIVSKVIRIDFNMENLPSEIWCNVFSRLDEKSVRSATLTCKNWFGLIPSDPNISGHICLKDHSLKEFLTKIEKSEWIWERWPALKTLELELDMTWQAAGFEHQLKCPKQAMDLRKQIDFKEFLSLEKVVFPVHFNLTDFMDLNEGRISLYEEQARVVKIHKMCFNPKDEKDTFGIEDIYHISIVALDSDYLALEGCTVEMFCDTLKFIEKANNIEELKVNSRHRHRKRHRHRHEAPEEEKIENAFQNLLKILKNSLKSVTVPNGGHLTIPQYFLRPLGENCSNLNSLILFSEHAHLFIASSSAIEFCYKTIEKFVVPNFIRINCLSHDCKMIVDMLLGSAKPWPWGGKGVKDLAFISQQLKKNKKCCMILELWNNEDHKSLIYEWQKLVNEKFQDNAKVEIVLEDAEPSVEV